MPPRQPRKRKAVHRYRVWTDGRIENPGFAETVTPEHRDALARLGLVETGDGPDEMKPERVQSDEI